MRLLTTEVDAFDELFPTVKELGAFDEPFPTFVGVSISSVVSSLIAKDVAGIVSNILGGSCDGRFLLVLTSASLSETVTFLSFQLGNLCLQPSCAGGFRVCNNTETYQNYRDQDN